RGAEISKAPPIIARGEWDASERTSPPGERDGPGQGERVAPVTKSPLRHLLRCGDAHAFVNGLGRSLLFCERHLWRTPQRDAIVQQTSRRSGSLGGSSRWFW